MKILLLQAPIRDFYTTAERHYPLGLLTLASSVTDLDVEVRVIDLLHYKHRHSLSYPDNFKILKELMPYDKGPLRVFDQYYYFGMPAEKIVELISSENADAVGISSNFYTYSNDVLELVRLVRLALPDVVIMVGGQNVNSSHEFFHDDIEIDILIEGEGSDIFRAVIVEMLSGRNFRSGEVPIRRGHGEKGAGPVHMPSSYLFPADAYRIAGKNGVMMTLSRGCPMACDFCTVFRTFGKKQMKADLSDVLEWMEREYARGIRAFDIEDDNFTFDRTYAMNFLHGLEERFGRERNIDLYAMNGLDARFLDEELLHALKPAGLKMLNLSLASASAETLERVSRRSDTEQFAIIAGKAASLGLKTVGYFIAGLPGTGVEEVLDTMFFLAELPLILGISPYYHIPGMTLDADCIPACPEDARLSRFFPANRAFDENSLLQLFRLSRLINHVKRQLNHADIEAATLWEARGLFPEDQVLSRSIGDRTLYGLRGHRDLFPLAGPDDRAVRSFYDKFRDCRIRMA